MRSAPCVRPGTMPSPAARWGSACSTTPRSARCGRARFTVSQRVAVIDFDVHHGNGTQACFWDDAGLFYASTHQSPLYPGTGGRGETGAADNIVNVPLRADVRLARVPLRRHARHPAGSRRVPSRIAADLGRVRRAQERPLAQLMLDESDYVWVTEQLLEIARQHAGGRVVSTLEGGYDLPALGASAAAHVRTLMAAA